MPPETASLAADFDAMILCAGLGTRLRPLTLERPKPAVPLLHRSLVGAGLSLLARCGFSRATVNTHWLPEAMAQAAREEGARLGVEVRVSHEPVVLGTAGGLRAARDAGLARRDRPLLVLNGDVLFDVDLAAVLRTHAATGAAATLCLLPLPPGAAYSAVEAEPDGRIRRIAKAGAPSDPARTRHLFSGVHVLSPEGCDFIPPGPQGIVETAWAALLERGARVQAAFGSGTWLDLGDPAGYLGAHLSLLDGTLPVPRLAQAGFFPAPAIDERARVHADARVVRSAVGAGAVVGAGARVTDSVLWPDAVVAPGEVVERTVVTPRVRVPVP